MRNTIDLITAEYDRRVKELEAAEETIMPDFTTIWLFGQPYTCWFSTTTGRPIEIIRQRDNPGDRGNLFESMPGYLQALVLASLETTSPAYITE